MMTRFTLVRGVPAAVLIFLTCGPGVSAEPFPFDQELLLDAAPMRPGKRMPALTVEPNGNARIDLWCRTVSARIEISEAAMKIEAGPLPEGQPEMMSAGQCTPERMQADEELLAALSQVTGWRWDREDLVLDGPKPLRFRASDH
jgi:heat shock protein HslJ